MVVLKGIVTFLCGVACVLARDPPTAYAAPPRKAVSAKLIGGRCAPELSQSALAYIKFDEFSCSGILVGSREVLTAAHCVADLEIPIDEYSVWVGGGWHSVSLAYYNSSYDPFQAIERAARHDLAILVLDDEVTSISPQAILTGRQIRDDEQLYIAGYGTNERSNEAGRSFIENAKEGRTRIEQSGDGVIYSKHTLGRISSCAGDSGGPAIQSFGRNHSLVGILSAGSNDVRENGACVQSGGGVMLFVNLQSASSQRFLSHFPNIQFGSYPLIRLSTVSESVAAILSRTNRLNSLNAIKANIDRSVSMLRKAIKDVPDDRTHLPRAAIHLLSQARDSRSLSAAKDAIKQAQELVSAASALPTASARAN